MVVKNQKLFLSRILLFCFILFALNFISSENCWLYDNNQSLCENNNDCQWKSDNWGSWCEELNCWSIWDQSQCTNSTYTDLFNKNCTWSSGGEQSYCAQASCWSFSGKNESFCVNNSVEKSCNYNPSCYSVGGTDCWGLSQTECGNKTGCAFGECFDRGCWDYGEDECELKKDPWNGRNCTWINSTSQCTDDSCWNTAVYPNRTTCNSVSHCRWQGSSETSGWCEEKGCWSFDGNQTGCLDAENLIGKDCDYNNGYCNEKGCWQYDNSQENCNNAVGCVWETWTSSGWCEELQCWSFDSWNGGNRTTCEGSGLDCVWEGNPSDSNVTGWCFKDFSGIDCTNITTEKACYDTFFCWWEFTDLNNISKGGNCSAPNWGVGEGAMHNDWNPGCYIFDNNETKCNNVIGCKYENNLCDPNSTHEYKDTILNSGINCTMINNSEMCNSISVLSSCCSWSSNGCSKSLFTTCWDQMQTTPSGETMCEDATSKTNCEKLANDPWYWPCSWDNSTTPAKCTIKSDKIWGNGTKNLLTIENKQTCEIVGGRWITENYCEQSGDSWVSVPTGRCEYKFDEERNCNKACFACEFKSDGTAYNTSASASSACLGSTLGYCEFTAFNSQDSTGRWGTCNAKDSFKTGATTECSATNCGGCTSKGSATAGNGTKTPKQFCDELSESCKWVTDTSLDTNGYCVSKDTKICEDACDRCNTRENCVNDGRENLGGAGSCIWDDETSVCSLQGSSGEICWDGIDNTNNSLVDCADPSCYGDPFCGMVSGDCFLWSSNETKCGETSGCEWVSDKWGSWCDFAGASCWKYDATALSCSAKVQISNQKLDISGARLADNAINSSYDFTLNNSGFGLVPTSVIIVMNGTGVNINGNYTVALNNSIIRFANTEYLNTTDTDNITLVTYQYYSQNPNTWNCEWSSSGSSSGGGWCENDWSLGEICFDGRNESHCTSISVDDSRNCTWTNDTWCQDNPDSDWCAGNPGWCDHPDFKPVECWKGVSNDSCSAISSDRCEWNSHQNGGFCDANWSMDCWQYGSSSSCESNNCYWKSDPWGDYCANPVDECWGLSLQSSCNDADACIWDSQYNYCTSKCNFYWDEENDCASSNPICVWKEGWCEESGGCWNNQNETSCGEADGCRWKEDGWCDPKGGGFSAGGKGAECWKYDGNQSACINSTITGINCGWMENFQPMCEVDWSSDCWQYGEENCTEGNGCWWNSDGGGWCGNIMDQCWSNSSLQNNNDSCNENSYCSWSNWGCQSSCMNDTLRSDSTACSAQTGCKYMDGWCDPAGMINTFSGIQSGPPIPIAMSTCGEGSGVEQASVDICALGIKDLGASYGIGIGVDNFVNSSTCNNEQVISGVPTPGIMPTMETGRGNDVIRFIVYLDTDGSTTGNCQIESNASLKGFEFKLRYYSEWDDTNQRATETYTAWRCDSGSWKSVDIKLSAWKKIMCSEAGGPMISIEKSELTRFPTLYDSTKDIRIYAVTAGDTGNVSSPLDTIGPGWFTPGSVDFDISNAFSFGTDTAKFEDILKKGFVHNDVDCFTSTGCADYACYGHKYCQDNKYGVHADDFVDTRMPRVVGVKIEEYPDSALVMYDTNKPTTGQLQFYGIDSKCLTGNLNATINDTGLLKVSVKDSKLWHDGRIYNDGGIESLNFDLSSETTYYYKLKVCDDNEKCAISKCTSFRTSSTQRCAFCSFVTRIKAPTGWKVSYDLDTNGTYEHIQGQMCGASAGMKTNYTSGRKANIKLENSDGSVYFEFLNVTLTKTGLNDKVRTISTTTDLIADSTKAGMTSETRDKIINNLHPEVCRVKVPKASDGSCTTLYHCDDDGNNCVDRTSESTKIDATNCVWEIPYCEFSTYKMDIPSPSGGSTSSSSGSSSSSGGGAITTGDEEDIDDSSTDEKDKETATDDGKKDDGKKDGSESSDISDSKFGMIFPGIIIISVFIIGFLVYVYLRKKKVLNS